MLHTSAGPVSGGGPTLTGITFAANSAAVSTLPAGEYRQT